MSAGRDTPGGRRPLHISAVIYCTALLLAALSIGPGLWLVLGAFQPVGAAAGNPLDQVVQDGAITHPSTWATTANFQQAWRDGDMGRPLLNSIIVTFARAGLNVILAALAAYPLARMRFRGRRIIFLAILATTMIPEQVIVVPMFRIALNLGLYDTLAGVVVPFSVSAFGVFMCRQAFMQVPKSVEEAAVIDGASSLRIWWSVMLPLITPTLATLALFSIIFAWSDLLWSLIILQSPSQYTLPVAINSLLGTFSTNPRVAYAASVLALVPIVVIFIATRRFFRPEMFGGATKG
ncbi:MAG: carbohydrate ABC transporter permease [Planctomycetota bacterium]